MYLCRFSLLIIYDKLGGNAKPTKAFGHRLLGLRIADIDRNVEFIIIHSKAQDVFICIPPIIIISAKSVFIFIFSSEQLLLTGAFGNKAVGYFVTFLLHHLLIIFRISAGLNDAVDPG